jgi:hypothetical protein
MKIKEHETERRTIHGPIGEPPTLGETGEENSLAG